jgi:hypothetical protein
MRARSPQNEAFLVVILDRLELERGLVGVEGSQNEILLPLAGDDQGEEVESIELTLVNLRDIR